MHYTINYTKIQLDICIDLNMKNYYNKAKIMFNKSGFKWEYSISVTRSLWNNNDIFFTVWNAFLSRSIAWLEINRFFSSI